MSITITYYKSSEDPKSPTLGHFGVNISGLDLNLSQLRLSRNKNGHKFISPPQYKHPNGEYKKFYSFQGKRWEEFQKVVMKALEDYARKKAAERGG